MFHLFLLIISILTSNGYPSPSEHSTEINIVGGKQVIIEDYPYMLSLLNSEGLYCGGCIISNLYALTAGHCVTFASEDLIIHSGSTFWNKNGSYHHILYNIIMGSFKNKDLAILRVKEPFIFDATRQPIPIFSNGEVAQAGTMATILGWGDIKPNDISEQLRAAEIPIIDRERCRFIYINISIGEIVDGEICAGYLDRGGKDSCQGDSGGPLVIDGRLAGIISMGNGCARPNAPGIYTDIGYYNKWINKHINS